MDVSERRRGRSAPLIAVAAVLGVVAGTCAGYAVQAGREPTPLPSLSQPSLGRAEGEVPVLSAALDPEVRTEGDLRELLVEKPKGAKDAPWLMGVDGWEDIAAYANDFTEPGTKFGYLVAAEFRRSATVGWEQDATFVRVRLVQFHNEGALESANSFSTHLRWADAGADARTVRRSIPGTGEGTVYLPREPVVRPGGVRMYWAQAHAWRGDIAMEIWVDAERPIPEKLMVELAGRQMERL
ncbi:hypothetical protein AB0D49_11655 [Streptomyces sp. NPDC048290]|uniref:hypothetical protein n=1 Tax=Streptomyces sp. NPDC048290 TaxID=3155811 RepID=UPI00343ACEA9